jgi:2-polyprenyl-3-methyl-5-hydroxy-6-metoxy-1,4-benzoquinol methylase
MKARIYSAWYRWSKPPWDMGPRSELVELVTSGRIKPCRAIDLGCGTGSNAVFLAENGFQVTGVDFAAGAIDKARAKAQSAGVNIDFFVDDLTRLKHVHGPFEFVVDYGVLDDLTAGDRRKYVATVLGLTRPGSRYLLWAFEWPRRRWEAWHGLMALEPGEAVGRFSSEFELEKVAGQDADFSRYPPGFAAYLMTRR